MIGRAARPGFGSAARKGMEMGRVIKAVLAVVVLCFIGLAGYAYLGNLDPTQTEMKKTVVLDAD